MTDMLSQQNQSMTKTKSSSSTMDNANNSSSVVGSTGSNSKEKIGASATTNNSSTNTGGSGSGTPGNSATGKNNESGSQNVFQPAAELIPKLKSILPGVTQCTYTECYCEENVWKLCDKVRTDYPTELEYCHVAFISNKKRMVPMWRQKAGKNEEKLALWDYHVILLYNPDLSNPKLTDRSNDVCVVYDADSDLPFPTHFHRYVSETFRTENILQPEYHRFFRIIPATRFLSLFSSDRSHMLRPDRSWIKPPPNYPLICNNGVNNLDQFIDMSDPKNEFGDVFTLMELVRRFYKPRQLS